MGDVMGMLTDAFNMGKFGIDMVGKIFNCRGEITALVTDSKIDDILHDLQPLLALDVTEFDQQDINGFADNFKEASDDLKNQGKISRQEISKKNYGPNISFNCLRKLIYFL